MKGIILSGGTGSRLDPLTKVTNKHLLPVYNKPMIYYPLYTLINSGVEEILIISGRGHAGHFLELLGSGSEWDIQLTYEIQNEAGGIPQALGLAKRFANNENVVVILGDNIFQDSIEDDMTNFKTGGKIFLKEVSDANRFGVVEFDNNKIIGIEEKPDIPKSNFAVTGLYMYDSEVFEIIKTLKPSLRGELEITDVNNHYVNQGKMDYKILTGFWSDAGTFDSLYRAGGFIKNMVMK